MVQALFDLNITFVHLPGKDNPVADALSRAHSSPAYYRLATDMVRSTPVTLVQPCTYILSFLVPPILSRSGVQLACGDGRAKTAGGQGTGNNQGAPIRRQGPSRLHVPLPDGAYTHDRDRRLPLDRARGGVRRISGHSQEQGVRGARIHPSGGRIPPGLQPHPRYQGPGRGLPPHRLPPDQDPAHTPQYVEISDCSNPGWADGQDGHPNNVFRYPETVRGGATYHGSIQPTAPPHTRRHFHRPDYKHQSETRKELTAIGPIQGDYITPYRRPAYLPSGGGDMGYNGSPWCKTDRPTTTLQTDGPPHPYLTHKDGMGYGNKEGGWRPQAAHTTQPTQIGRHRSTRGGLFRAGNTEARGLVLRGTQGIH